ncbi:MAG: amidohydrolase family protein [Chitinophagaceae bacterium]|nr:amidohydrolase family protein [Chitinophagaceae bacterium]
MFRKFKADYIFTGHKLLHQNEVLVTNNDGVVEDIVGYADAGDNVETFAGLLTPGFINCHCHLELSHLKNTIPMHTGLVKFVQQVMAIRQATADQKLQAMQAAEQEMYNNGIVAVGDICNTADSLPIKQHSKLQWHNFIEVSGFVDAAAEKRLAEVKAIHEQFLSTINYQLSTLSPHAPYSVSKKLFQLLNKETINQLITIHNQECAAEDELYKHKTGGFLQLYKNLGIDITSFIPTGKTSLQSWLPYFTNKQSIISVHNLFTKQEDIECIHRSTFNDQQTTIFFCLCPNANQYIEDKMINRVGIELLMQNSSHIVIGTDSYASNRQLSILKEMKLILQQHIPLQHVMYWATLSGAKALNMEDKLGSFEKGKKPGIVLIDKLTQGNISAASSSKRIL